MTIDRVSPAPSSSFSANRPKSIEITDRPEPSAKKPVDPSDELLDREYDSSLLPSYLGQHVDVRA